MLAYVVTEAGNTKGEIQRIPNPKPTNHENALIRILRAGICNTDLEILKGYMGFTGVIGHEFVGVVEEVYNNDDIEWIGKRVCGDINIGCSDCDVCNNANDLDSTCIKNSRNHCPNRTVLGILKKHGTMAEYITLPIKNLHVVSDKLSDEEAVFAEPLAAACRVVEQKLVDFHRYGNDAVAVLGDGKLGLMIAEVLGREYLMSLSKMKDDRDGETTTHSPSPPVLFGKHLDKLDLVSDSGVNTKLVSECANEDMTVKAEYRGKYDVVVDATGSPVGLTLAASLCRPMGTLVLKSTCAAGETFNAAPFVIDELRVVGSRCGPIEKALELLNIREVEEGCSGDGFDTCCAVKPLNVKKYITKTFPLKEAQDAIEFAALNQTMKVQIICSES